VTLYQPHELVLAVARGVGFAREQPRNSNRGQAIEAMLKLTGLDGGYPWCAAFVAWCGVSALGERWPLPRTASVQQLYNAAEVRKLVSPRPEPGDVFCLWFPSLGRFAHTGFVRKVEGDVAFTVEGNTNDGGSRDGWGVFERTRHFGPQDRFIRWQSAA
jgi:hypothetical protein